MHIPDGVLDPATCLATAAISAGAVGYALRRVRPEPSEQAVPLMGVMAACVFAAQMLNFPIPGGTSGHVLGAVLAAVLLGPWRAMLVMSVVLIVQCLLFQDGGVAALGANVLNMGVVGAGVGYCIYDLLRWRIGGLRGILVGAIVASWLSVTVAAAVCAIELAIGGRFRLGPTMGAMLLVHSLIGLGEALATGLALSFILQVRPNLVYGSPRPSAALARSGQLVAAGLTIALLMAAFISPFASQAPDGLGASLAKLGFQAAEEPGHAWVPMADYKVAIFQGLGIAGSIAGAVGVVVVFAIAWMLARGWPRRPSPSHVAARSSREHHDHRHHHHR